MTHEVCAVCAASSKCTKLLGINGALCKPCLSMYKEKHIKVHVSAGPPPRRSFSPFEGSAARLVLGFHKAEESQVPNYSRPYLADACDAEPSAAGSSTGSPERMREPPAAPDDFPRLLLLRSPQLFRATAGAGKLAAAAALPADGEPRPPDFHAVEAELTRAALWIQRDQDALRDVLADNAELRDDLHAARRRLTAFLRLFDEFHAGLRDL